MEAGTMSEGPKQVDISAQKNVKYSRIHWQGEGCIQYFGSDKKVLRP